MRRGLLLRGVAILVLGLVIAGVGLLELASPSAGSTTVRVYSPGEYVSSEINISKPSDLAVVFNSGVGGLVPAGLLGSVNQSNLKRYAVPPNTTSGNLYQYLNISVGEYYFVVFSNNTPTISYSVVPLSRGLYAFMLVLGGLLALVGLVVTIVGALLKPKQHVV